jgi:hypothetical protein
VPHPFDFFLSKGWESKSLDLFNFILRKPAAIMATGQSDIAVGSLFYVSIVSWLLIRRSRSPFPTLRLLLSSALNIPGPL